MIDLKQAKCIGEGSARLCYEHPDFSDRCIKVFKVLEKRSKVHLKRELDFLKKFNDGKRALDFIPKYYGKVETSEGEGHVFELFKDFDGSISKSLLNFDVKLIDEEEFISKVEFMYQELMKKRGVLSDFHWGNVLMQKHSDKSYDLKIIDGFGNSDFIKVCDYSKYFLKKKLDRKFFRFLRAFGIQREFNEK